MRQPRPRLARTRACVSPLGQWRESQPEMAMARARCRSIFPFAVQYQKLAATNHAPAAAGENTRIAVDAWRKSQGRVRLSFRAKSRNGVSGTSDMDGNAARVAARESGDEQVKSPTVSELSRDVSSLRMKP